jgi:carotenoid cleavage dioxygenase
MSLTERFAVVYDLPVVFDFEAAAAGGSFPYKWDPNYRARVGLLPREGGAGDVAWFDVEPCYVFHPLNAYDDGDDVVLDVVRHQRMYATDRHGPNEGAPTLERWTVDRAAGKVREERVDDRPQELPRVDERLVGRRHRFGYAMSMWDEGAIHRHDYDRGVCETRHLGACIPGEAVFAPRTPDAAEDDGWVMYLAYDPERDASDFVLAHGEDFTGEPQAVVHLPRRVPFGFHGNWLPDA